MAGLGGRYPDFDGLLDDDQPKDTEVTILEEQQQEGSPAAGEQEGAGKKRSRQGAAAADNQITLEAHRVVLRSLSPCFRTKLERWSSSGSSSKRPCTRAQQQQNQACPPYQYTLQLLVPPGQLELGRRLITVMYSSSPDLSDLEVQQLMQLVVLAECYGVGEVVECAAAQLHQLKVDTMPIEIAAAVFELPEACLALEAVQKVQHAAADKLQQELGDLEVAWGDKDKQAQLRGLPFGALLQLLRDERTRVASEDTVVATALRWLKDHPSPAGKQQKEQLGGVFRLPHCTATFVAWLANPSLQHRRTWVCGGSTRPLIDLLAAATRDSTERRQWLEMEHKDKAAWLLPPRAASAVTQLELSWDLPLETIEGRWADHPDDIVDLQGPVCSWQGRKWCLSLQHKPSTGKMNAFLDCVGAPAFCYGVLNLASASGDDKGMHFKGSYVISSGYGGAFLDWGTAKEWPQVKAWLQQEGWVHPDGCLHLRATVAQVH